ncbi:unnamed protein product [Agarophyton chilense]
MQAFLTPTSIPLRGTSAAALSSTRTTDVYRTRPVAPSMVVLGKPSSPSGTPFPSPEDDSSKVPPLVSSLPEWKALQQHKQQVIDNNHLRHLLEDEERVGKLYAEYDGIYMDYSRQRITLETRKMLFELAEAVNLKGRIKEMFSGEKINTTENRAVLHTALRSKKSEVLMLDGVNVVEQVHSVLTRIRKFTELVRSGKHLGATGKHIKNFVAVGIGGSYLGPDFVYEALKTDAEASSAGQQAGYSLHFLANVDPVDVKRALDGYDAEETMVIIVSKTFTTRETIVNAKTVRTWLWDSMGTDSNILLSIFEHRTAVQGFIWDINSFDQWGVELGKVLATKVRKQLNQARYHGKDVTGFNASTKRLVERYLFGSVGCAFDEIIDYEQ